MSTRSLEESCNLHDNEDCLPGLKPCEEETIPSQQDLDDIFSISSGSPCPITGTQTKGITKDDHQANKSISQNLDKPGILAHLQHTSPLESIRELVEMEERSESRSPGDGAVRIKDACSSAAMRYVALPSEGCGEALERTALKQELNEVVDVSSSIDDILAGSCLPEDISHMALVPKHLELCSSSFSDHQKEAAEHQLTLSHNSSDILQVQLDNQSNIVPLSDLQEESICPAAGVTVPTFRDESEAEKNNPSFQEVEESISEKEDSVTNQSLIEVLTACEARVEQLEELRSSSIEMSAQLQSARLLTARLQQKVFNLEHQCHLKDKALQDMTVDLKKTSEALRTRNSEMAAVTEELQKLHLDLEAQKKGATVSRTVSINGQVVPNAHQRNGSSGVCTLV